MSDHNTPLIETTPCNCNTWHSSFLTIDSTRRKLREVNYTLGGQAYKRIYYVTLIDSVWTDVCDAPLNCKSTTRTRVTQGSRPWFVDLSTKCDITSFSLPCCSDKDVNVRDIAKINYSGSCPPVFSPARLLAPTGQLPSKTETVSVTVNGKTLTATITMINPTARRDEGSTEQAKLARINEAIAEKWRPVLNRANDLLTRHLGYVGEWKGEGRTDFKLNGSASNSCCQNQPGCLITSYSLAGDGNAGISGRIAVPVAGLPVVGKYLSGVDVAVKLGSTLGFSVSGKTTCTDPQISTRGESKLAGNGNFSFKVAGFIATGEIVAEGGSLSGDLTLWPNVDLKCVKLNSGKLKLTGTVEDKWGFTQWNVNYTIWNGVNANLAGCK